jgi:hypothetical protein
VACAAQRVAHVEYFHDHARIERMLFDGALAPRGVRSGRTSRALASASSSGTPTRSASRHEA